MAAEDLRIRWTVGAGGFIGEVSLVEPPDYVVERFARAGGELLFLTDLFVHPLRRGRGWSSSLLSAACRYADRHCTDLWLYPHSHGTGKRLSNVELIAMYEAWGFESQQSYVSKRKHHMVRRYSAPGARG